MTMLTYRRGTIDEVDQISALLQTSGLFWPGAAATPYVAVDEEGIVRGVYFKCVCLHAEPLAIEPGHGVSVTELGKAMRADLEDMATELGHPLVIYMGVQNSERALAAAQKNGVRNTGMFLHEIVIMPREQVEEMMGKDDLVPEDLIEAPPVPPVPPALV